MKVTKIVRIGLSAFFVLLVLGVVYVVFFGVGVWNKMHERREPDLAEIQSRSGLQFPPGTVLLNSYLDFFMQGREWGAKLTMPREGFQRLLKQVPKDADRSKDLGYFPKEFHGKTWWKPAEIDLSVRVSYVTATRGNLVVLIADTTRDPVTMLLYGAE